MIETEATIRKWGRSLGVVIPKEKAEKLNLGPNEKVRISISKSENPLAKLSGTLNLTGSTKELLEEVDEDGWDD